MERARTLLFTDIEGSTRLLESLGERYAEALSAHRRLLREAFLAHDGAEVGTEGDAFFVVFADAEQAVRAATAAQQRLAVHRWPEGRTLRVRMGIHTGTPTWHDGSFVGLSVHEAARICSAAHGGQVLVSELTVDALPQAGCAGVGLREMGRHRLKDLSRPLRLFQLVIDGLPSDFPAIRTLENRPNNLPAQLSDLIGRETELGRLKDLFAEGERLVTVTGPGGVGKTRLAVQAGAELLEVFPDGVYLAALAPLSHPDAVLPAALTALGGRAEVDESSLETLARVLGGDRTLLVFDNFEHVLDAAPLVVELLRRCPRLGVLATSRAPLRVTGEHSLSLGPLAVQASDAASVSDALATASAEVFVYYAQRADPSFVLTEENVSAVVRVCRALDGLPLALELAAARIRLLGAEGLVTRSGSPLSLGSGARARDLPARQRTLQATIQWSFDLLDPAAQKAFSAISVFTGGCEVEAAEEVCETDLEVLEMLLDAALVRSHAGAKPPRLSMLQAVREFAAERLAATDQGTEFFHRHAMYYLSRAEAVAALGRSAAREAQLERLDADTANFEAAIRWALANDEPQTALALAGALGWHWDYREHHVWGRQLLREALAAAPHAPDELRIRALYYAGRFAIWQGDRAEASRLLQQALALNPPLAEQASLHIQLGFIASSEAEVLQLSETALGLARASGDQARIASALDMLGGSLADAGELERARPLLEEALALSRNVGELSTIALRLTGMGELSLLEDDPTAAAAHLDECLRVCEQIGYWSLWSQAAARRACAALETSSIDTAISLLTPAIPHLRRSLDLGIGSDVVGATALIAWIAGRRDQALTLWQASDRLRARSQPFLDRTRDKLGAGRDLLESGLEPAAANDARPAAPADVMAAQLDGALLLLHELDERVWSSPVR